MSQTDDERRQKRANTGNYDMKAKVVAEKLRGKKDLEIIQWAESHLNFHIRHRRNIYRWKENPIILKLAEQYAGLIENADVPDIIKSSYRRPDFIEGEVYKILIEYVATALEYEVPVDLELIEHKFNQVYGVFGMPKDMESKFQIGAIERIKNLYEHSLITSSDIVVQQKLLKSLKKQTFISDHEQLKSFIATSNWSKVYFVKEIAIRYQLFNGSTLSLFGSEDRELLANSDAPFSKSDSDFLPPNNLLTMIYCANLDGTDKCKSSFLGPIFNPKKLLGSLDDKFNYYYTKTGWLSSAHFQKYLEEISNHIKSSDRYQGKSETSLFVICDESHYHSLPDSSIPGNMKLIIVKKNVCERPINTTNVLISQMYVKKVLQKLWNTIRCLEYLQSYEVTKGKNLGASNYSSENLTNIILHSLQCSIYESVTILSDIWNQVSEDIVYEYTNFRKHSQNEVMSIDQSGFYSSTVLKKLHQRLAIQITEIKERINSSSIVRSSMLACLDDILVQKKELNLIECLDVEALKECQLIEDFIYGLVKKKIASRENPIKNRTNQQASIKIDFELDCQTPGSYSVFDYTKKSSMVSSAGNNGPAVDSVLCKRTNPSSIISFPKPTIASDRNCKNGGFSINSILNEQSENEIVSESAHEYNNRITFQVEYKKDNKVSRIDNTLGQQASISDPMEKETRRAQNLGKRKIATNQVEEANYIGYNGVINYEETFGADDNYTQYVADFKKAVYDLHLHFTTKPFGPNEDFEIYKEMSFEKIYSLVVGIEQDKRERQYKSV
ncbi:hypothetical protein DASC09_048000 [Saccharomycopsis crataegensis]|uniref:DDE-1 domain-containing protein n=1 Tax=Saccharomycopsis crataegensis TaxID=43959 RepID=A0AAV5QTB1_9ASCO|nr:hypothetical protein DASC09_048000 [Saccharomycopsis crataegensis]